MKVSRGSKNGKKKTWKCKEGCKLTRVPCRHLERLLQDPDKRGPSFESVYRYAGTNVDRRASKVSDVDNENLRRKLEGKLDPIAIHILVLRYTYDEPFAEISEELKVFNTETVIRIHDESIKKLRGVWKS